MYSRSTGEVNSNRVSSSLLRKRTRLPTHAHEVEALTFEVTDNFGSNVVLPCGAYGPRRRAQVVVKTSQPFPVSACMYACSLHTQQRDSQHFNGDSSSNLQPVGHIHGCEFDSRHCRQSSKTKITAAVSRFIALLVIAQIGDKLSLPIPRYWPSRKASASRAADSRLHRGSLSWSSHTSDSKIEHRWW